MCRVLAALHQVDWRALGLETFGKAGNYFQRQTARWSRQCEGSTLPLPPSMRRLMEWLPDHIPQREETTLLHGDYRLDNLLFHPSEPRVTAVLDWELSTLGDPLADLSYTCLPYRFTREWEGLADKNLTELGIPTEDRKSTRLNSSH